MIYGAPPASSQSCALTNPAQASSHASSGPNLAQTAAPRIPTYRGTVLLRYGNSLCPTLADPARHDDDPTASEANLDALIAATIDHGWDGIDFYGTGSVPIERIVSLMEQLKQHDKHTSYGFNAGKIYNHPACENGKDLNREVHTVIKSGYCDRLIHHCYADNRMWSQEDNEQYVVAAVERSLAHGAQRGQIILALTTHGLTDASLEYFLEQIIRLEIGGLFVWAAEELSTRHEAMIVQRLELKQTH
jgi:hypothetical protein